LKNKIGETSYEEAPCFKRRRKKEDEIYKLLGEILSKERKKRRSHFAIVQNPMYGLIHTHTSFEFALPSIP
jgi:hypothetical protein